MPCTKVNISNSLDVNCKPSQRMTPVYIICVFNFNVNKIQSCRVVLLKRQCNKSEYSPATQSYLFSFKYDYNIDDMNE